VGLPPQADLTATEGDVYTLQAGDVAYESVSHGIVSAPHGPGVTAGLGYWALFSQPTAVALPPSVPDALTGGTALSIAVPSGQYIMIGNPYSGPVSVLAPSGDTFVYLYDTEVGAFRRATSLDPGQGAFAYSASGEQIVLCPRGIRCP